MLRFSIEKLEHLHEQLFLTRHLTSGLKMYLENHDNNLLSYLAPTYTFSIHELCSMKKNRKGHYHLTSK